jgi:hypothetical protein
MLWWYLAKKKKMERKVVVISGIVSCVRKLQLPPSSSTDMNSPQHLPSTIHHHQPHTLKTPLSHSIHPQHIHLITLPLPPPPLRHHSSRVSLLHNPPLLPPLMQSLTTTRHKHQRQPQQTRHHPRQHTPHTLTKIRMRPAPIAINMILHNPKQHKVARHNHNRDDERQKGDQTRKQGSDKPSAESEEKGDKCETAGNGV